MQESTAPAELLFAYGTLQLERVQITTFGRRLAGTIDTLQRYALVSLDIEDPAVIATSGKSRHTMARYTGRITDAIPGVVFAVTPDELRSADTYEVPAVVRVAAVQQSLNYSRILVSVLDVNYLLCAVNKGDVCLGSAGLGISATADPVSMIDSAHVHRRAMYWKSEWKFSLQPHG